MTAIACAALMAALLAFSEDAMHSALTAAQAFVNGVMPALLPMVVLGKMLPNSTKAEHSGRMFWLRTVFFAFAAGSPAAAQRARELRGTPGMDEKSWETLLCLTGVMSPMFFTGTLAGWLQSPRDGWTLLGLHWAGAAITAALWRMFLKKKPDKRKPAAQLQAAAPVSLPSAIAQSAQALLCVCGAMMVFSVAAGLLKSVLTCLFPTWMAAHTDWLAVVWALLEIGGGASAVTNTWAKPQALLSALCGFGGLSIWLQNLLFLGESIRPVKLLGMRAVHGAVCYALAGILRIF